MENIKDMLVVKPDGVCRFFDRASYSLDEEMDACDLCNYYVEEGSRCSNPDRNNMNK